jgi:hypothetical protein
LPLGPGLHEVLSHLHQYWLIRGTVP